MRKAGGERRRLAEVASQAHEPHRAVGGDQSLHYIPRAVGAAVVDEDDLVVAPERLERGGEARVERLEVLPLVEDRQDDRDALAGAGAHPRASQRITQRSANARAGTPTARVTVSEGGRIARSAARSNACRCHSSSMRSGMSYAAPRMTSRQMPSRRASALSRLISRSFGTDSTATPPVFSTRRISATAPAGSTRCS